MPDLGTYHVKVRFNNARDIIYTINTGHRYTNGTPSVSPISATLIRPIWDDEEDLISTIIYMWTKGNYSCDCNRSIFISEAYHEEENELDCGNIIELKSLTLVKPDASEIVIFEI